MSGCACSVSSTSLDCTSLPVSPYLVSTTSTALPLMAPWKPALPASTQPAPGGPGNQATLTGLLPFGCILASTSPAFAPISPKDTSDLADNSLDEMPLITSI